jgi:uncharacterized membrane protein YcaP (DUF421 family)
MHTPDVPFLIAIALRTLIVFLFLAGGLRLLGKRQIGQMNIYDLALVLAVANSVQNAMTAGKGNLAVGMVSAGTLFLVGRALTTLFVRMPRLHDQVVGTPRILINEGRLLRPAMRREHVTEDQVMHALRQHGLRDPDQVKLAVLEVDGSLSIVPADAPSSRTRRKYRATRWL